ncbi:MFS transporter [Phormidium tenue FACHB-886]|nr:MFS transporter [Phormidium tenue FACHB-886]
MFQLAQMSLSPHEFALEFLSGSQFFIALIAGVVMAFAFQFILSTFSVAAGISAGVNPAETHTDGWGKKIRKIEAKVGSATLFIVNVAVFIACFLAVKLTLIRDAEWGAIVSVVIWSVYFLLLLWLSSQAIGSLVGTVGNTATSGLQGVMATVGTALSGQAASRQIANTVETSVDAVSKELQSVLSSDRLRDNLQNYVSKLPIPQPNSNSGQAINLPNNVDLPPFKSSDLLDLLRSATSDDLASGKLRERLTQLLGVGTQNAGGQDRSNGHQEQTRQGGGLRERTLQMGTEALIATLVGRSGLSGGNLENFSKALSSLGLPSNLNLETLAKSVGSVGQQLGDRVQAAAQAGNRPSAVVRSDVENYLLNSPAWYLRPNSLDRGFREVLFDPDADAGLVRQQLEQLNRSAFVEILQRRDGIAADQVNDIADELELIRREVLDQVRVAEEQARSHELRQQVETYFTVPKEALTPERISQDFTALLADPDATYETLGNRLLQFDRDTLMQMLLAARQDLSPEETEQILNELEGARDRFLNQSQESWNKLQAEADAFREQIESYIRDTNPAELTPAAFQQTLQVLLETPGGGLVAMRTGLGQLDRTSLEEVLSQRQDLNPEQVNQLIEQIEAIRDGILHAPQELAQQAKEQTDRLTTRLGDYLRNTNLEELDPDGIQRDLRQLLDDPQAGASALRSRLAQVDRETLVKLLSQRQDLSEAQVTQAIDRVQEAIRTIVRTPQQFAARAGDRLRDFQSDLENYLRNTDRGELNPDGIKRDLQLLIKHPQAGISQFVDRLSLVDRDTLVALLSQREDISEEEANQIADQIASVRDQVVEQARRIQTTAQSAVDNASDKLRNSLNSLGQPELNYEGIQRDIRTLFDDPEAGLEALRDRLGQFDRETLVALLSSRSDISEEQANRIIDQIEAARDSVLQRAERVQGQVEKRIQTLKHQAKEQAEEVQKTVAAAAWWLWGTAITSVATAAIAGVLASSGFNFVD